MLQLIRYEKFLVAYKLFVLAGRLISDSVGVVTASQLCPAELLDSASTIIFGSDRFSDIPELKSCSEQFFLKWGENFVSAFRVNKDGRVNPQLVKCCVQPNPVKEDTIKFLKYIGKQHNVSWEPKEDYGPESLGCMKAFPLGYMEDGSTDITIPEDDPEPISDHEEEEEIETPPDAGESMPPPSYEEPPPQEPPKSNESRGQYYYIEPKEEKPQIPHNAHLYQQQPAPTPQPAPEPKPEPKPEPQRVAAYPAMAPQPVPTPVAAYPAAAPQSSPVAAYPAAAPTGPVAAYPAMAPATPQSQPQQPQTPQSQQQPQDMSLEARMARLQGK